MSERGMLSASAFCGMAMLCLGTVAEAAPVRYFSFVQGGYPGGALLAGLFSAADDNGNGVFEQQGCSGFDPLALCEFRSFRMLFTGNGEFPAGRIFLYSEQLIDGAFGGVQDWRYLARYDPSDPHSLSFDFQQLSRDFDESWYKVDGSGGSLQLDLYYGSEVLPPIDNYLTMTTKLARVSEVPLPGGLTLLLSAAALATAAGARRERADMS